MKKALEIGVDATYGVDAFAKLRDVLPYTAKHSPDKGVTYIDAQGNEEFVSYPEMLKRSIGWLGALQELGCKPGERIFAEIADPKDYHILFWSCVFGGFVLAPLTSPTSWEDGSEQMRILESMWKKLDKPVIITHGKHRDNYQSLRKKQGCGGLRLFVADDLCNSISGVFADTEPDDTAYIQFSSGTTGDPKGVMMTYEGIRHGCASLAQMGEFIDTDTVFSWLPHTHAFGVFHPYVAGMMMQVNMMFMLPDTFYGNPNLFFSKISEHRGAWFCSNNSGLDWAIRQIPDNALHELDLSSLKVVYAGGENISKTVIDGFYKKFSQCGVKPNVIRPVYGLSETMCVIMMPREIENRFDIISRSKMMSDWCAVPETEGNSGDSMLLTGNGIPLPGVSVRIANERGDTLNERDIGEIQIKGTTICKGYYGVKESQNENINGGRESQNENINGGWFCTGDLGYLCDGFLFITGRKKDIVIIRGVNYIITDIEDTIYNATILSRGMVAVSSVMDPLEQREELIAFIQFNQGAEAFLPLRKTIIDSVNKAYNLNLRLVIPLDPLLKTDSGKPKRMKMKQNYESGQYSEIENQIFDMIQKPTTGENEIFEDGSAVENLIVRLMRETLDSNEIGLEDNFFTCGGESVKAAVLIDKFRKMGIALLITDLYMNPTPEDLAYLSAFDEWEGNQ